MGQLVLPLKDVGSQARCHFNNGIFSNFSLSTYLKKSTKEKQNESQGINTKDQHYFTKSASKYPSIFHTYSLKVESNSSSFVL
jgi:hypothetical protein